MKELVQQFENCTLPRSEWNHAAHLRIALWYIFYGESLYEAITKIRCGLIHYGALTNKEPLCTKKYHETITMFWVGKINEIVEGNKSSSIEEIESLLFKSRCADKNFIYEFYSEEVLQSPRARALYILP